MSKITIGHRSYGTPIIRGDISDLYIGRYCSIAQNVIVDCGFHHRVDFVTTYPLNVFFEKLKHITGHPKSKGDVVIGNDVWIGEGTILMGGITIGDGAVIGAGSLVTKNVEPYQIVGGVPARFIKNRFPAEQVAKLLKLKWWDKEEDEIVKIGEKLMSNDLEGLFKIYDL